MPEGVPESRQIADPCRKSLPSAELKRARSSAVPACLEYDRGSDVKVCGRTRRDQPYKREVFTRAWRAFRIDETFIKVIGCADRESRSLRRSRSPVPVISDRPILPFILMVLSDRVSLWSNATDDRPTADGKAGTMITPEDGAGTAGRSRIGISAFPRRRRPTSAGGSPKPRSPGTGAGCSRTSSKDGGKSSTMPSTPCSSSARRPARQDVPGRHQRPQRPDDRRECAGPGRLRDLSKGRGIAAIVRDRPRHPAPSAEFAELCARVLAAAGFKVFLFTEPRSTPLLSFAVRHLRV